MSPKVSDQHKEQRMREILEAAKRVFVRKGFEPTTMKDIVKESGKSFGGVYMYYSNTDEIFTDLLEHGDEKEKRKPLWQTETSSTFVAVGYEFFVTSWREKQRLPFWAKGYEEGNLLLVRLIQQGAETGEFRPLYPLESSASW